MSKVVLNPIDEKRLSLLVKDLPQSLLLTGDKGIGLATIAHSIADKNLAGFLQPQNSKEQIDNESGTISVEMIRGLYTQTRAKHTGRQVIIIDNADRMSAGAQAAFLKLLEEPNDSIHFILTSHAPQKLVLTIISRIQEFTLHPITHEQTTAFLDSLKVDDKTKRAQLQFIADGFPAELSRLITNDSYFKQRAKIMGDARTFLQSNAYEKVLIAQEYQGERPQALQLVDSCMQILRRSISAKPQQAAVAQLTLLLTIRDNINSQHNIRLQLARFVL